MSLSLTIIGLVSTVLYFSFLYMATDQFVVTKKYHKIGFALAGFGFMAHLAAGRANTETYVVALEMVAACLFAFWMVRHGVRLERLIRNDATDKTQ